jgi:ERF superfamily protein
MNQMSEPKQHSSSTEIVVAVPSDTLSLIKEMALNPNVDADKLEKLTNLHLRLLDRDHEDAYNKAMLKLRPELPTIKKNGSIDYGKGKPIKYATIDDIQKEIEPIYQKHGFFVEFDKAGDDWVGICKHEAGHKVIKHYPAPADMSGGKNSIQGLGSAFSYAQRGLFKMIFNLKFEGEDDDGAGGPISEEQAIEIKDMLKSTGMNVEKFLKSVKAASVDEIKTCDHARALNSLQAYAFRQAEEKKKEKPNAA